MNLTNENERQQKLDRWLDAALPHYAEDEPRVGLEGRILAILEAQRAQHEQRRWPWRWVLAAGAAGVLIAAVIALVPRRVAQPPLARSSAQTAGTEQSIAQAERQAQALMAKVTPNRPRRSRVGPRTLRTPATVSEARQPRLPRFPTPAPLSEQERLLVALVNNTPPDQLAQDAAMQQRLRREVEQAWESGGGAPELPSQ